jgi:polyferredoxin
MAIVGFFVIIWVERVFHSTSNPVASAMLLTGLIVAATVTGLVYTRESWCRYLCPLGRFATALAPASPLQLTAKRSVCASSCTTHACFKGTSSIPGCTVFHHPLEGKQAHRCKLCLDCLRSCPHGSARLQLRSPLIGLWRLDASATDITMFAIAVSLLAVALIAERAFAGLSNPVWFTTLCGAVILLGITIHATLLRAAAGDRRRETVIRVAATMMIVGWGALMTGQLSNIPALADTRIVAPDYPWLPTWFPLELNLLVACQLAVIVLSSLLAVVCLSQIRSRASTVMSRVRWAVVYLSLLAYVAGVLLLVLFEHGWF